MPSDREPLSADVRGLILSAGLPHEWVQPWDEIYRVLAQRQDFGLGRVDVRVTLDHVNGEFFELLDDDAGFDDVVRQLAESLPGLADDWYRRVLAMPVNDPDAPAVVWQRA